MSDIEGLASEAYARLPDHFRSLCENLVIRVEDFPTDEVLESMHAESEFDLLGLFQGVGLPFQSDAAPELMPNMIWLYRRPILDYWAEHEDTLGEIVTHELAEADRLRSSHRDAGANREGERTHVRVPSEPARRS